MIIGSIMVRVRLLFAICRFGRVWCVGLFVFLVRVRVIVAEPTVSMALVHINPSFFSISNGCGDLRIYSSFYPLLFEEDFFWKNT